MVSREWLKRLQWLQWLRWLKWHASALHVARHKGSWRVILAPLRPPNVIRNPVTIQGFPPAAPTLPDLTSTSHPPPVP